MKKVLRWIVDFVSWIELIILFPALMVYWVVWAFRCNSAEEYAEKVANQAWKLFRWSFQDYTAKMLIYYMILDKCTDDK